MSNLTVYGGQGIADAIKESAAAQTAGLVRQGQMIRSGLIALGFYIGVTYPLMMWVLSWEIEPKT